MWAKQSTAATLIVGPILDSAGAEYTSAVIGDLSISKNGGTLTALAAAATLTHIANGQYTLVMTTGNLDTLGRLQITCNKSTYQMPPVGLNVVPAMVFDSMVLGTDVLQSDVTQFGGTAGTFAAGIPTAALDSASRDAVADAVWDEAMADHTGSGSYGGRVVRASNSNTTVQITGSNHVAADVHEFQAGVITAGDFAPNSLTASALAADAVAEIQNGLSTLTAAQVNAELVDALSVDTYAELAAPPAATSSLKDKITWLFMYARNKVTQTASQRKLYRDDGSTVAGTSGTSDDGTTFTKGEDA